MTHKFKVGDTIIYRNTTILYTVVALGKYISDGDDYYDLKAVNEGKLLQKMHGDVIEAGCDLIHGYGTKLWEVLK